MKSGERSGGYWVTYVAVRAMIFELAISIALRWRSFLMVTVNNGGNAYHDRNAIMKPSQENVYQKVSCWILHPCSKFGRTILYSNYSKIRSRLLRYILTKTLPYLLTGFRIGTDRAFPLTGLISGACQRVAILKPMVDAKDLVPI